MEGNKFDFEYWVSEFMNLFIYKEEDFFANGKLDTLVFQKEENKYMYIPSKSGHLNTTFVIYFGQIT